MQGTPNDVKRHRTGPIIAVTAGATATLGAGALGRLALGTARAGLAGVPVAVDDALVAAAAALAVLGLGWLVLTLVLAALAGAPGAVGRGAARLAAAVTPRAARQLAALLLGAGVVTAGAGTASAASGGPGLPDPGWSATAVVGAPAVAGSTDPASPGPAPDPGWTPDAPRVRPQPDVGVVSGRFSVTDADAVVVHRGDSLWTLAAHHLGPGATDAEVARAWPRWYAANRAVIGADPDLLLPGQVLRVPAVDAS
ncbi:hypothetical protein KMZ32_10425 [Phycicoccus sp. MAQZ13P-2]|uniref:LysM peptidoglycan-binding domain-containing protein n=1 Tax=Phycicoccus mangrovi TaxID=2840470 RepID=UPI001C00632C|nr:hypothetical protein [Phycicoccus mangrovi]MBT9255889.1 hypothetical protein [Phycicoccus mangrovi]MBT9274483.1 hypothetical protein [Phycicoccus mangrovi]